MQRPLSLLLPKGLVFADKQQELCLMACFTRLFFHACVLKDSNRKAALYNIAGRLRIAEDLPLGFCLVAYLLLLL
jgi:hypothetical protein